MSGPDYLQLAGAFLGGGLFGGATKTFLDYLSKDRLDRRAAERLDKREREQRRRNDLKEAFNAYLTNCSR